MTVLSIFGLVFSVSAFAWICCQRKTNKSSAKTPPYKFVHMLKGVDIYPESLTNKEKIAGDKISDPGQKTSCGHPVLHLDLEKRDLNGNFTFAPPILQAMVRSSPDQDIPSPHPSTGLQEDESPESNVSSQTPTPALEKVSEKENGVGTLSFSLEYNFEKKAFIVNIKEANGLSATDEQSLTSDPYIKLTLLPEKKHKVKTRVLRKTLDPTFDETFSFYGIPYSRISQLSLHFMVLSFDRFSRDEIIGETLVPLADVDLAEGRVIMSRDIIKRNVRVRYNYLSLLTNILKW